VEENDRSEKFSRIDTAALVLIGVGLFLRLLIGLQPPERLLPVCLADDAFYYLKIAANIWDGRGPTFDGHIETNGYHPLWMGFSLLTVKIAGGVTGAARMLTVLLALIGCGNNLLLWRLARRITGPAGGIWAAGTWALGPYVFFTELMGVEAPLMIFIALAAAHIYLSLQETGDPPAGNWAFLGLLIGLALLARTDAILMVLPFAVDVFVRFWLAKTKRQIRHSLLAAGVALLTVAPWILYNLMAFGTVFQDSARALVLRERMWFAESGDTLLQMLSNQFQIGIGDYLIRLVGLPNVAAVFGLAGMLIGGTIAARLISGRPVWRGRARGMLYLLAWGGLTWIFYLLYFWQQKFWYFLPVSLSLSLLGALAVGYLARHVGSHRQTPALFALLGVLLIGGFALVGLKIWNSGYQPWQTTYVQVAQYLRELKQEKPDLKVGALNSGVISAWSGLDIVNLDGVVNPDAREAMEDRDFPGYLRREGIQVVVDHAKLLAAYHSFSHEDWRQVFRLLESFPTKSSAGDILVLRVIGVGEDW